MQSHTEHSPLKSELAPLGENALDEDLPKAPPLQETLHRPRDANSVALTVLAVMAVVFALHWAQAISMAIKAVCDRVVDLKRVGELLGD